MQNNASACEAHLAVLDREDIELAVALRHRRRLGHHRPGVDDGLGVALEEHERHLAHGHTLAADCFFARQPGGVVERQRRRRRLRSSNRDDDVDDQLRGVNFRARKFTIHSLSLSM